MSPSVQVFAVEATGAQLTWSRLPGRQVTLEVGGQRFDVDGATPAWYRAAGRRRLDDRRGGPGALDVEHLDPATDYDVVLSGPGLPARRVATLRTADPPPGPALARFATVNDCHIGERRFGPTRLLGDPVPRPAGLAPYPVRALRAALDEAVSWGAGSVVAKGDITQKSKKIEADAAAAVLGAVAVPVHAILGNHDVHPPTDVAAALRRAGVHISSEARSIDLPGVRLVLGHSPVPGRHGGRIAADHMEDLARLAAGAAGPAVVALHHPPGLTRVPRYYPPPIHWADARALLDRLAEANPAVVLISGHTHRNRWYRAGRLRVAEVGSTKDYPGQWAGYTVYEGGIAQVVRRIAAPDVIAWTDMTSRALGGVWGRWSPGTLRDRCWFYEWPVRPSTRART